VVDRLDRARHHRPRELERREASRVRRVVQRVGGLERLDLGDGHDVARRGLRDLDVLLALVELQVRELLGLARARDDERGAGHELAGHDARQREPAHVGVDDGLEDEGRAAGRARRDRLTGLVLDHGAVGRRGQAARDELEQLLDALSVQARDGEHRDQVARDDRAAQQRGGLVLRGALVLLEEAREHGVVDLDHGLEQRVGQLGQRPAAGAAEGHALAAGEGLAGALGATTGTQRAPSPSPSAETRPASRAPSRRCA
jgi:hypothetical protein